MTRVNSVIVLALLLLLPATMLAANKNTDSKSPKSLKAAKEERTTTSDAKTIKTQDKPITTTTTPVIETPAIIEPTSDPITPIVNAPETGEQIDWQVISSGATDASTGSYHLLGTLGQVAVGTVISTSYTISQGYWQDFGGGSVSCCGMYTLGFTGNTDCDIDGKRNLADITKLIDHVYISKLDLCCGPNGNVDGDPLDKHNLADITKLIDHVYISKDPTAACL